MTVPNGPKKSDQEGQNRPQKQDPTHKSSPQQGPSTGMPHAPAAVPAVVPTIPKIHQPRKV